MGDPLEDFFAVWDREAEKTAQLLASLPPESYDFRPDPGGRSIGELAWHLAEGDAYISFGIAHGNFEFETKPPNIQRPLTIEALAPGYQRIHEEARDRLRMLTPAGLDREMKFFDGTTCSVKDLLWDMIVMHSVHHRGQLSVLARLAGAAVPGMFGPAREQTQRAARK